MNKNNFMTLRIFFALFAISSVFGVVGSANAAEQVLTTKQGVLEMKASSVTKKKDFKPKKRKKSKPRRHGCEAYGG